MFLFGVFLVALSYFLSVYADQIAITDLPLYNEATTDVRDCVYTEHSDYITSYGCTVTNPAACLCSNATSSYHVASAISHCLGGIAETDRSEFITATEIFASYCLTNAGISARDETLLQDFALYSRATWYIGNCATSVSSSYSTALGCDFYTPAACLCGSTQSATIQSAMLSCASQELDQAQLVASTITELWSSYCSANLATSAARSIEAVATESGSAPTQAAASSAAPSATASTPMSKTSSVFLNNHTNHRVPDTATGTQSGSSTSPTAKAPTSGSSSSSSNSSGSGLSVGAEVGLAIGCAFGAALLTMMATWWKPAQVGRFVTCGAWPRKAVDTQTARAQMTHIFTGHSRPGPTSHIQYT
ncbi:hypothetical protein MMC27_003595 [Xylographa pallens]|nr:hypothetical protein [Xylographa pallens]